MADWDETLRDEIIASQYRQLGTRDEIIQYYQQEYPGQRTLKNGQVRYEWKEHLTNDLLELNPDAKRASISRRFQKDTKTGKMRFESTKPSKAQEAEYKALGQELPPLPPENPDYAVHVSGSIRISNECKPVSFTVTVGSPSAYSLQGANAKAFTEEPNVYDLVLAYWQGDDPGYNGWCSGPEATVS
jgi:hypothetical protein